MHFIYIFKALCLNQCHSSFSRKTETLKLMCDDNVNEWRYKQCGGTSYFCTMKNLLEKHWEKINIDTINLEKLSDRFVNANNKKKLICCDSLTLKFFQALKTYNENTLYFWIKPSYMQYTDFHTGSKLMTHVMRMHIFLLAHVARIVTNKSFEEFLEFLHSSLYQWCSDYSLILQVLSRGKKTIF